MSERRNSVGLVGLVGLALSGCGGSALAPDRVPGTLALRVGVAAFADLNPLGDIERLAAWGADYAEPALSKTAALSDAEFEAAKTKAEAAPIRCEAANWFVPGDVKLTGPTADGAKTRAYLEKALARAEALGVRVIVFGSSGARNVPEGWPRESAWAQLVDFLRLCDDVIDENGYGMVIAIEPLRKPESNIVNTAAEGLKLAKEADRPSIRLLVDFYHLAWENESPDILLEARDYVAHTHIALPNDKRSIPKDAADDPRLDAFFANLQAIGYRGRMSLEGNLADPAEDVRAGLKLLREMAARRKGG